MRVMSRAMSVFLSAQELSGGSFRHHPVAAKGSGSSLAELRALKKHKTYAQFSPTIDYVVGFVQDSNHTVRDSLAFLGRLAKELYPDKLYLCDISPTACSEDR